MSNLSKNDPQNIEQNFDELELVAEKAGELNDRVGKIESELGAQTKTLESAALVLDAAIKGLGALKSSVLENDIGALQLALNDKTAHLAREIGRFESAVAEIDRRAESGDDEIKAALLATAQSLRAQFDAKSAEIGEWSARVEKEIAAHSVALAAIPPIIKGADAVGFNPVGEWETGKAFARMDVVSYAGSSYISNVDGNTEKPSKSKNYTVLSKRAGSIGSGGVGGFAELTGTILPAQLVPGSATYVVGDVLYAGTTGALSKLGAGSSGQLLSTQGAGAAPIWVTATGGAGDMNGPASATDNAIVRFDGTGGKTVQNSAVTIADTTGAIAGASSLTAPASTDLTLTGGSTGAALVLGHTAGASMSSASKLNLSNTTSASSSTVGALTIGNGSAATNVAIGGGKIWAGSTEASTGSTSGSGIFAGGIYAGAASVFGAGIGLFGATPSSGLFGLSIGAMSGTNQYGITDQNGSHTVTAPATEVMGHRVYSTLALGASGTLTNWYGFNSTLNSKTGAAVLTNAYAFYANSPTQATNNYAFYSAGTAPSVFGGAATFAGAVSIGNTVSSVSPTSPNRTITIVVGGVTLYIAAKTTND